MMRSIFVALAMTAVAACGKRGVEVRTAAQPMASVAVRMTNNLSQAVNVYVVSGGSDIFLKQVAPNSTEQLPVQGVATGASVTLKAVPVDNSQTYTRDNVVLTGTYMWQVP